MALIKQITMDTGVTPEYWKIQLLQVSPNDKIAVVLGCYLNKAQRLAGMRSIKEWQKTYPAVSFDFNQNIVAQAYSLVKCEAEFSGALDD